jgi:very-short-patch-repair endonuclease
VVSLHWQSAPPLDKELDQIVAAMAVAAKNLWPRWYATVDQRFDRERWPNAEVECRLDEARRVAGAVSAAWFRKAWAACQRGQVPIVRPVASGEQLRQLAIALDPRGPLVLLLVSNAAASPARIHALARAAEWLASQATAAVTLVLPEVWRGKSELDIVSYDSIAWESIEPTDEDEQPLPTDGPRILVEPTIGEPHPASRAEQKLFEVLTRDRALGCLFQFNRRVVAFENQPYRVDLLCQKYRIVVEIDGMEHRSAKKYRNDRDRDYRLLLAGYLTLRLTNEDILDDITLALQKLRNVVGLRSGHRNGNYDLSS